jgi:hypothetical protein
MPRCGGAVMDPSVAYCNIAGTPGPPPPVHVPLGVELKHLAMVERSNGIELAELRPWNRDTVVRGVCYSFAERGTVKRFIRHHLPPGNRCSSNRYGKSRRDRSIRSGSRAPGHIAMYAAARTIPLAFMTLAAIYRRSASTLFVLGSLARIIQSADPTVGLLQHDRGKFIGPLITAVIQFCVIVIYASSSYRSPCRRRSRGAIHP